MTTKNNSETSGDKVTAPKAADEKRTDEKPTSATRAEKVDLGDVERPATGEATSLEKMHTVPKGSAYPNAEEAGEVDVHHTVAIKDLHGEGDGETFTRKFVLRKEDFGAGYDHTPNFTGTTQDAVNVGLRPTGDVEYIGNEDHPDGKSTILTYRVPATAAWADDAPTIVVDAQEVFRDGVTPADERTPVDPEQVAPRTGDARYSEAGEDPERQREGGAPAEGTPAAEEKNNRKSAR